MLPAVFTFASIYEKSNHRLPSTLSMPQQIESTIASQQNKQKQNKVSPVAIHTTLHTYTSPTQSSMQFIGVSSRSCNVCFHLKRHKLITHKCGSINAVMAKRRQCQSNTIDRPTNQPTNQVANCRKRHIQRRGSGKRGGVQPIGTSSARHTNR